MNQETKLTIWGGAGEHGRSCYYLHNEPIRVLLDCGVKKTGPGEYPLLPGNSIPALDAVFLSHAHEDHSIAIPLLYKLGYKGKIWATRATIQKLPHYFSAWEQYVNEQLETLPYDNKHIEQIQYACLEDTAAPGEWKELSPGLRICWGKSGHIVGSVWLMLDLNGKRIFYSGDFTAEGCLLSVDLPSSLINKDLAHVKSLKNIDRAASGKMLSPDAGKNQWFDLAIIEAAYGLDIEDQPTKLSYLTNTAQKVLRQKGWLLLPVPVIGRGQDLLLWVSKTFPDALLFVEEEVAYGLTEMLQCPEWLRPGAAADIKRVLKNPRLVIIKNSQQREEVISAGQSGIILTGDGMLQTNTARWYYHRIKTNTNSSVVFTGHLPPGSQGNQIWSAPRSNTECAVELIYYKVHQGLSDLRQMLKQLPSRHTVIVHTGKQATDSICTILSQENYSNLHSLSPGECLSF